MNLLDLVARDAPPTPWSAGSNIPWHDEGFSRRMLAEHLSQSHDAASRRFAKIDEHIGWIHRRVLGGRSARILDLGCGPGLYTSRLAALGHRCVGIDYSPASVAYARRLAEKDALDCSYILGDITATAFDGPFDLAMVLYGEFNVFPTDVAREMLGKIRHALLPDGALLIEPHTFDAVRAIGLAGSRWYSSYHGLFSDQPHLVMEESFWDEATSAATTRYHVLDAASGCVASHGRTMQGYSESEYTELLRDRGYHAVEILPSLTGAADESQAGLLAVACRKPTD